ncbi:MAG: hypothetical protein ACRDRL_24785 [Sciscionella sp.]
MSHQLPGSGGRPGPHGAHLRSATTELAKTKESAQAGPSTVATEQQHTKGNLTVHTRTRSTS